MTTILITIATVTLLVFINGLYVAAEFSTVAARKTRVSQMAGAGRRGARALLAIMEDGATLDKYVAACQLGITASSLVLGAYGQRALAPRLTEPVGSLLERIGLSVDAQTAAASVSATGVLLIITILQVIIGELTPKSVAIQFPERVALAVLAPMRLSMQVFRPFIWFFNGSGNFVLRLMGFDPQDGHGAHAHSPEEIEILVTESHEGGLLNRDEQQMLRNAFRLRELTAREVMVHRTRLIAAPVDSTVRDLLQLSIDAGYSRIPLYEESIDTIRGFVHVKDVYRLYVQGKENLLEIVRKVVRVPETMPVVDIWETLQDRRQYIAIIFDEYGGTAGMVTFEDLIEEIFGELQDEFDDELSMMSHSADRIHLRGDLLVSDVNEYLHLNLPADDAVTLSGLIISRLGRPPRSGDVVPVGKTNIRVESVEDRGVISISLPMTAADMSAGVREWEMGADE